MPIYEYRCEPCENTFETLTRRPEDVAHCPRCGSIDVAKQFSVPAAARNESSGSGSLPVCNTAPPGMFGCGGGGCGSGMCSTD